jgi:hypothetical protein
VPSPLFATQMEPKPTTIPAGAWPVGIVRTTDAVRGSCQRRVLVENRPLEVTEFGAGLEAELVPEHPLGVAIDRERVRLTARAVEGRHQLRSDVLAKRVLRDERFELADQRRVATKSQVRVDTHAEKLEP